jgi:septal ring factor EnvC (AmiA/AmiB activator)
MKEFEITTEMLEMSKQIKINREEMSALSKSINELNEEIKRTEATLMEAITNELDENGKPLYKNADQRNAELTKRLKSTEQFEDLQKNYDMKRDRLSKLNIETDFIQRGFDTYKLIGYLNCK